MLHLNILDGTRQSLLPLITTVAERFYLAGGTALALQLGHRDSIDFDFFIAENFDTVALWKHIEQVFTGHSLQKTQEEKNTLSCIIDNEVRLSFFGYHYPLFESTQEASGLHLASIIDIGAMKLSAITSRSTWKDYIDLYTILKQYPLETLLTAIAQKYHNLDETLVLKSLVYFDDLVTEPIMFMPGYEIDVETVKTSLRACVTTYFTQNQPTTN